MPPLQKPIYPNRASKRKRFMELLLIERLGLDNESLADSVCSADLPDTPHAGQAKDVSYMESPGGKAC
jgi:hypothetical protein